MIQTEALRLALEALESNRRTHYYCEDTWYSCPKHEDGCANEHEGDECNCGADKANAGIDQAITAIKAALEAKDEPVAWLHTKIEGVVVPHRPADLDKHPDRWEALYKTPPSCSTCEALSRTVMLDQTSHDTTPPQRTWVGLTDEEIAEALGDEIDSVYMTDFRRVEAKLKEKNT